MTIKYIAQEISQVFSVDLFEPDAIEELLAQTIHVERLKLNLLGYADYLWHDALNLVNQVERKTIDEILSSIDHVEEQLSQEIVKADRTYLMYEGTFEAIPGSKSTCQSFRKAKGGTIMIPNRKYKTSYTGVMAWFDQLDRMGITVVNTIDYVGTAMTLIALYNNGQKKEHTTFNRYIKPRVFPKSKNPHVKTLMGISGAKIGEETALALVERFGTAYYVLSQDVTELADTLIGDEEKGMKRLGETRAKRILEAIGRKVH